MTATQTPPAPTLSTTAGRAGGHHVADGTAGSHRGTVPSVTQDGDQTRATGLPAGRADPDPDPSVLPAPDGAVRRESARAERAGAARVVTVPARARPPDWVCEAFSLLVVFGAFYVAWLVLALVLIHGGM